MIIIVTIISWLLASCSKADPSTFDCPMRQFLLEFATKINPSITSHQLQDIADALNGAPRALQYNCNVSSNNYSLDTATSREHSTTPLISNNHTIYVDTINGDDSLTNTGLNINKPLKTLQVAIIKARILFGPKIFKQILLRQGTYYLQNTIYLNNNDSNLLINSYPNEQVNISGAVSLNNLNWTYYSSGSNNLNNPIYSAYIDTNRYNISDENYIYGLRINGQRGIRARYPNVNSEETLPPSSYTLVPLSWITNFSTPFVFTYNVSNDVNDGIKYVRNDVNPPVSFMPGSYEYYLLDINNSWLNKFVPNIAPPRFGNEYAIGIKYDNTILPNSINYQFPQSLNQSILKGFMNLHWNSFMWDIDSGISNENEIFFIQNSNQHGGNQGAHPSIGNEFYIENIFEELDSINEWYYDIDASVLYYIPNITNVNKNWSVNDTGSGGDLLLYDIENMIFEATKLKTLFELKGNNQSDPIENVTFTDVQFMDTRYTYLDYHGIPSGMCFVMYFDAAHFGFVCRLCVMFFLSKVGIGLFNTVVQSI